MNWHYTLARNAVITEFIFIIVILITIYSMMLFYFFKGKKRQKLIADITAYFAEMIPTPIHFKEQDFPKQWQRIDLIVPILYQFTRLVADSSWQENRQHLIQTIMLPLARKAALSKDWVLRFFAAICFGLVYDKKDEKLILALIKDDHPLIQLNALYAAIGYSSESAINSIITTLSKESWLTQSLYLPAFEYAPIDTRLFIINILKKTTNPLIKVTCYIILLKYPPDEPVSDVYQDIHSTNIKLKLAAIILLSYLDKEAALPMINHLLLDKHWQARTIALDCLYKTGAVEARLQATRALNDKNKWVRFHATEIIKNLEEDANPLIKTRDIEKEGPLDLTLQVLDTL